MLLGDRNSKGPQIYSIESSPSPPSTTTPNPPTSIVHDLDLHHDTISRCPRLQLHDTIQLYSASIHYDTGPRRAFNSTHAASLQIHDDRNGAPC